MHWYIRYNSKSYFVLMCQKHWYIGYSSKPYFKILRVHDMALLWIKGHSHKWKKKKKKKELALVITFTTNIVDYLWRLGGPPPPPRAAGVENLRKIKFYHSLYKITNTTHPNHCWFTELLCHCRISTARYALRPSRTYQSLNDSLSLFRDRILISIVFVFRLCIVFVLKSTY